MTLADDSNAYRMNAPKSNDLHAENALRLVSIHKSSTLCQPHEKNLVLSSQELVAERGALLILQYGQESEGLIVVATRNKNMGGEAVDDVQRQKEKALEVERQVVADEGSCRVQQAPERLELRDLRS